MKKWILLLALCAAGQYAAVYGQVVVDSTRLQAWTALTKPGSTLRWLKVRDNIKLTSRNFFDDCKIALGLSARDKFELTRSNTDELGISHFRYQQYFKGYKVENATYILHERNGRINVANGHLATGLNMIEPPVIMPEAKALQYALELIPTKNYLWLDKAAEADLKKHEDNPDATFYPSGEMVWIATADGQDYRLAWKFDIHTSDGRSERICLDVATYGVLKRLSLDIHCDPGTGTTTWNGTVNMNTSQSGSNFILHDDCQSPNIHVFNMRDSASTAFATEYTDGDNAWNASTQSSAVQTFYGLTQSWQYFQNQHTRDSYDDGGADIKGYNQAGFINSSGTLYWSNASWSPGAKRFKFGDHGTDGTATDDWNSIDIVGHEFSHAVTTNEADLEYKAESGALNESFSDIFGEMIERFTDGNNDWLIGGDRGYIRNMSDPKDKSDPDTYLGTNWVSTTPPCNGSNDKCGVHTNSGVQNYWFYLLADGDSGINDNNDYYDIQGIGATKAANIAYRNLTEYLTDNSDYADAKMGAIQSAIDLYGDCSNEVLQCARAWNAVGVYTADGLGYDIEVDCPVLDFVHMATLPYFLDVFNDIRSDCDISPSNGAPVVFEAGHAVILKPGFTSGDNFHAYIDPCPMPAMAASHAGGNSNHTQSLVAQTKEKAAELEVFPNPFRSKVRVRFDLATEGAVSLRLVNAYGHRVHTWYDNKVLPMGEHTVLYTQSGLPNGLYTVELQSAGKFSSMKMIKVGD